MRRGGWPLPCPGCLTMGKSCSVHFIGGWVGPGLVWRGVEERKTFATTGFEP